MYSTGISVFSKRRFSIMNRIVADRHSPLSIIQRALEAAEKWLNEKTA
jgi:hypothetical protein